MTTVITIAAFLVAVFLAIAISRHIQSYCRFCGSKMTLVYDPEEDAEVYQCPTCGRSYIIR